MNYPIAMCMTLTTMHNFAKSIISALGVYDGRVYEALWERAQAEPLNKTEVTAAYEVSINRLPFLFLTLSLTIMEIRHL